MVGTRMRAVRVALCVAAAAGALGCGDGLATVDSLGGEGDASADAAAGDATTGGSDGATDAGSKDSSTGNDAGSCGMTCPSGSVCCEAPLGCAGMCVQDCRNGGSCSPGLTCNMATGVCSPAGDGGAPPPQDGGGGDASTSACGTCQSGYVCCEQPLKCAGTCVPDCRVTNMCPQGLTCDTSNGVCSPGGDGGMPPPGDGGMPPPDGGGEGGPPPPDGGNVDAGADAGAMDASSDAASCYGGTPPTGSGQAEAQISGATMWASQEEANFTAISGGTAAVGHPGVLGSSSGYVTIDAWNGCTSAWEEQQVVTGSDTTNMDAFGSTVSLYGSTLAVDALDRATGTGGHGIVYVFKRSGTTWTQGQEISPASGSDDFGYSIALVDKTMAVGGPIGKDPSLTLTYTGVISVYTSGANGHWSYAGMAYPSTSEIASWDAFGASVAYDGTTLVGGAPGSLKWNATLTAKGKAWVFAGSGGTWSEAAYLTASDGGAGDYFGKSVGVSGTTVVVGAPDNDAAGSNAGAAYVFTSSGGTWTQQAKLTAPDASASAYFGFTVAAVSPTRVLVGAPGAGKLYSFTQSGSSWTPDAVTYTACSSTVGYTLSVSGSLAVTSQPGAFVFDLAAPTQTCVQ